MKQISIMVLAVMLVSGVLVGKEPWFAPVKREVEPPELPKQIDKAFVIPIKAPISNTLARTIENKIVKCKAQGAQIITFDIDTPGGAQKAMDDIVGLITDDLKDIYTVAFVNNEAISAGAIISLGCSEIVMTPGGSIGDAMPILVGGGGVQEIPKTIRAKIESYMRNKVRVLAQRNGHSEPLCEAMVTMTRKVWLVKNKETNELKLVDPDEKSWSSKIDAPAKDEKTSETAGEKPWKLIDVIDRDDELVTLTTKEAVKINFVQTVCEDLKALEKHYSIIEPPVEMIDTWSEKLVAFMTSPAVSAILLMAGIFFLYVEANTPGLGLPGGLALLCFVILFGSRFLIGLANWWEIALFAVGVILLLAELFVIPGFGIAGIAGIICCLVALLAMAIPNAPGKFPIPASDLEWKLFERGIIMIIVGFAGGIVGAFIAAQYLPKIPYASRLILAPADVEGVQPVTEHAEITMVSVGDTGTVEATCRPVGKVQFGDVLCDATADCAMIKSGTKVKVIRKEGNHLIVDVLDS